MLKLKAFFKNHYPKLLSLIIILFFVFKIFSFWQQLKHEDLVTSYRFWFEHQKWFFTAYICLLFFSSFAIRYLKELIIICFGLGYYLTNDWILQDWAYDFFMSIHLFELIGKPNFKDNPEFAHVTLTTIGILLLLISLVRPTFRIRKVIILTYAGAILAILYFVHNLVPTPVIRSARNDRAYTIQYMLDHASEKIDIEDACQILNCLVFPVDFTSQKEFQLPAELDFSRPIQEATVEYLLRIRIATEFSTHFNAERNPIIIAAKKIQNQTYLIVDSTYSDRLWKRMKGSFSGIVSLAILTWTFLVFLVIEIHHMRFLTKIKSLETPTETKYQI